jgi:NADH-quinone oxidoreductase subunit C
MKVGMSTMTSSAKDANSLRKKLNKDRVAIEEFRGETRVILDRNMLLEACQWLRDDLKYDLLAALTAVDDWPHDPRFRVVYQFFSTSTSQSLALEVRLKDEDPNVTTIEEVYPNANWHEREVYDMFGIVFDGHSDLRRIILPHDWEGHPLRKDYPLGDEEVQFSFNFDEIERRKYYAKD